MLRLTRGADSVVVAPAHGGAIVGWTRNGRHLLRRPSPEAVLHGHPGAMGCFPMLPYCNRIAHRRFVWDGRAYELAANFGDHPHAIHGIGWQRPWVVESAASDCVSLSLRHNPDHRESARAWPFGFLARLTYRLTDAGLTIEIASTNTHTGPAPMGMGVHPWFRREAGDAIAFAANGVWLTEASLPATHVAVPSGWDHFKGRAVDGDPLDHCFTGWRGEARLPAMRIAADPVFGALQVFTPAKADFFCIEPVSHVPNAIGLDGLPQDQAMTALAPGGTLCGAIGFSPRNPANVARTNAECT